MPNEFYIDRKDVRYCKTCKRRITDVNLHIGYGHSVWMVEIILQYHELSTIWSKKNVVHNT